MDPPYWYEYHCREEEAFLVAIPSAAQFVVASAVCRSFLHGGGREVSPAPLHRWCSPVPCTGFPFAFPSQTSAMPLTRA